MKVDYDSEGRSLLFEFDDAQRYDRVEEMSSGECIVWLQEDHPTSVQLLDADRSIEPLQEVAERWKLSGAGLRAAAQMALSAPDREITIEMGQQRSSAGRPAEVA